MAIAQNWLDLEAERGPSSFDQRHLLSVQAQYTTGSRRRPAAPSSTAGGAPYIRTGRSPASSLPGAAFRCRRSRFSARRRHGRRWRSSSLTGVSSKPVESGSYANAAAFPSPAAGAWGNAGRNSLRGPSQFSFDASLTRTFRLKGRLNLEYRISATNLLNRVTFATINTVITSPQFGCRPWRIRCAGSRWRSG
jgi:hypothetical protein